MNPMLLDIFRRLVDGLPPNEFVELNCVFRDLAFSTDSEMRDKIGRLMDVICARIVRQEIEQVKLRENFAKMDDRASGKNREIS